MAPSQGKGSAADKEGNVAAQPRCHLEQFVPGHDVAGKVIDGEQNPRRIARPTTQAGPNRDALGEREVNAELLPGRFENRPSGADREIVAIRPQVSATGVNCNRVAFPPFRHDLISQGQQAKERLETVIAGVFPAEYPEHQVDLGVTGYAHSASGH